MEEWKASIDNYEISNKGNIRRKSVRGGYINIKGSITNRGYKYFQLVRDGKRINHHVHNEVARLFIGERPDGLVIDHIDRNKLNNEPSNLRYITQKENTFNRDGVHSHIPQDTPDRFKILQKEYQIKNADIIKNRKHEYYEKNKDKLAEKIKEKTHIIKCSNCNTERTISHQQYNIFKRKGLESNMCKKCAAISNLIIANKTKVNAKCS